MQRWKDCAEKPQPIDDTPVEMPVQKPEKTSERIARMIAEQLAQRAQAQGFGTWEEEEDFEDEDPNLLDFTNYELDELQGDELLPDPTLEPLPSEDAPASPVTHDAKEDKGEATPPPEST